MNDCDIDVPDGGVISDSYFYPSIYFFPKFSKFICFSINRLRYKILKMAPSITETVSETADQIHNKIASVSKAQTDVKPEDGPAPAVQAPAVESQHKEPLKLSGALDHFEHFDVTPVIGREFIGVNLAKWLRASNSDELIRDLAITSTDDFPFPFIKLY